MWHIKKELGPCPKNWGRGANFKMTAKIREIGYLRKSRISEKSSGLNENCSSSANFWANDLKSFAFERYELYLCDSNPKLGPYYYFRAPILVKSQKFQILRYSIFPASQLCGPRGRTEKIFWTRKLFCCTPYVPTWILIPLDPTFVPRFWRFWAINGT